MSKQETSYRSNTLLKKPGTKINFTEKQIEEYVKCSTDVCYFVEKYVKIVNVDKGLINMKLYPFQREILNLYNDNKYVILKLPRQSSKTTTTVAYFLWVTLFSDHYSVAILANKGALAREILSRYQLAYENLPLWLQQGIIVWNRGNIELENGSKIVASATTSSSIRGNSYTAIFCDELGHVPNTMAEEFFTSVFPTISSGTNTKMIISSTPNGINMFYKFWTDAINKRNNFIPFSIHYSQVPGRDEKWKEEQLKILGPTKFAAEYECTFLGSTNTLVSGEKLACLTYTDQINVISDMKIYEEPIVEKYDEEGKIISTDHIYFMCVDISEGNNMDYSAFVIFDGSVMPYKQVATYRSNTISPLLFPNIIKVCAEYYNNAYVLVEINNQPQVPVILADELEYERLLYVSTGNKQAQTLCAGFGRGINYGLKMSTLVKRVGCAQLKTLLETDKLILTSFDIISELTTFVYNNKNSYEAEEGNNDDFCSCLIHFAWMVTQQYFKEIVENDIRVQLQREFFGNKIEENIELPPMGHHTTGLEIDHFIEGGCVWIPTHDKDLYGEMLKELLK